jgi:hypothetical protein
MFSGVELFEYLLHPTEFLLLRDEKQAFFGRFGQIWADFGRFSSRIFWQIWADLVDLSWIMCILLSQDSAALAHVYCTFNLLVDHEQARRPRGAHIPGIPRKAPQT